jgi:hypothetical protein
MAREGKFQHVGVKTESLISECKPMATNNEHEFHLLFKSNDINVSHKINVSLFIDSIVQSFVF